MYESLLRDTWCPWKWYITNFSLKTKLDIVEWKKKKKYLSNNLALENVTYKNIEHKGGIIVC